MRCILTRVGFKGQRFVVQRNQGVYGALTKSKTDDE